MGKIYYLIQQDRSEKKERPESSKALRRRGYNKARSTCSPSESRNSKFYGWSAEECSCSSIDERAQCTQVEQQANGLLYPKGHYKDRCASLTRSARCSLTMEYYKHSQAHTIMGHPHLDIEQPPPLFSTTMCASCSSNFKLMVTNFLNVLPL